MNYQAIFNSKFAPASLFIKEIVSSRAIDDGLEERCNEQWEKITREALTQGKKIWDSEVYRFEGSKQQEQSIEISVSTIPFSIRLAMNNFTGSIEKLGKNYAPLGMFASCFVLTPYDEYIFIEKSDKYYTNRKIAFVGGIFSKSEKILKNGFDLFEEVNKEAREEIGISQDDIVETVLRAGYITENYNFCLIFEIKINKDFERMKKIFPQYSDQEANNIIGVRKKDLDNFVIKLPARDLPKFEIAGLIKTA